MPGSHRREMNPNLNLLEQRVRKETPFQHALNAQLENFVRHVPELCDCYGGREALWFRCSDNKIINHDHNSNFIKPVLHISSCEWAEHI